VFRVRFGFCVKSWYNRGMNNELDPTRDYIVAKINAKKAATQKLVESVEGLDGQISIYDTAILKTLQKLETQRSRKEAFEASKEQILITVGLRQSDAEHMEEILSRFDEATAEGDALAKIINTKITESNASIDMDNWKPGASEDSDGLKNDKEYQEALARKRYINDLREASKSDVSKIMVARGEVSGFNVKGRKGV